jgi:hypothetical protein
MWRLRITKAYSVDIVLMARDTENRLSSFDIIDIDRVVASSCYNLPSVTRESYRPDLSMLDLKASSVLYGTYTKVCMKATRAAGSNVCEVEKVWLGLVVRVSRC